LSVDTNSRVWVAVNPKGGLGAVVALSISTGIQLTSYQLPLTHHCCSFPKDVQVDPATGDILVSDGYAELIWRLDGKTGQMVGSYTTALAGDPTGIAITSNNTFWTADDSEELIVQLQITTGASITRIAGFEDIAGITIDSQGRVYVADAFTQTVTVLNNNTGQTIAAFTNPSFGAPWAIAVSRHSHPQL
jgi:DNA-binding beta-propeller fold protein YncE